LDDGRVLFALEEADFVRVDGEADTAEGDEGYGKPRIGKGDVGEALAGADGFAGLGVAPEEAAGEGGEDGLGGEGAELVAGVDGGTFGEGPLERAGVGGEDGGGAEGGEEDGPGGDGFSPFESMGGAEADPGGGVFELIEGGSEAGEFGADGGIGVAAEGGEVRKGRGKLAESGLDAVGRLGGMEEAIHLPGGQREAGNSGIPIEPAGRGDEQEQENSEDQACSVARGFDTLRGSMKSLFPLLLALAPLAAQTPAPVEKLSYSVEWRMVNAGAAVLTNNAAESGSFMQLHLHSAGLVSKLFKVNDNYTVELNDALCAQNSRLEAEEGKKRRNTTVVWSEGRSKYVERDLVKNEIALERELEAPGCVHDILGALMVLRRRPMGTEREFRLPLSDGKKFVQARVQVQEKEKIKTPAGQFTATRYEAFLFNDVLFKRDARLFVWLSDDERRLPVQIQVRMRFHIGTVTFQLDKVEP
jgi:hypothetical protein